MFIQFIFSDGSNPYITKTYRELFKMLKNNYCEQVAENAFIVHNPAQWLGTGRKLSEYKKNKAIVETLAKEWQWNYNRFNYSYQELVEWQGFFTWYGTKYGLLKDFEENGII